MKKKIDLENIIFVIISIFPVLFITGPFLTDLFCITLGLILIFYLYKNKLWNYLLKNNYFYFFLIFYFYIILNSAFSFDPNISFLTSLPFLRIILFIFALSIFLQLNNKVYKSFYIVFIISIFCLTFDSVIQFFFQFDIFRNQVANNSRISSFFGEELIMGSYVSRLLPLILSISFAFKNEKKYSINLIIIILSGFLITVSGERLATFYYICTVILYFLLTKRFFLRFIFFTSIILILNILYNQMYIKRIFHYTISQLNQTESVYSYRHTLHFKTAFDMFLDEKIKGHGLKSFRYKCSDMKYEEKINKKQRVDIAKAKKESYTYILEYKNGCNTHPHNIYLEFLSELGVTGFLFLFIAFIFIFIKLLYYSFKNTFSRNINENEIGKSLILLGIFLQLLPILPSGSFFNNWMLIIFHISVGFYFASLRFKYD